MIADLHLHSKYSRAVSKNLELPIMAEWATKKGIDLLATGDWTHPAWLANLKDNLVEDRQGIFRLRTTDYSLGNVAVDSRRLTVDKKEVHFLLSCEIASIYQHKGRGRRVHNIVIVSSFGAVDKIRQKLLSLGANLSSDGRPMLGVSSRDLAEISLAADEKALIIPAHAWTPWYGVFGSMTGYDSLEETFEDLSPNIYAIETGLSSDPAMNWRVKELDNRAILSFSDGHSPAKFGREATVFELKELSYGEIHQAISLRSSFTRDQTTLRAATRGLDRSDQWLIAPSKAPSLSKVVSTIEFYPEEGKYHFTGHRNCQVCLSPAETAKQGTICPVCGRSLTVGVAHRVEQLAQGDRPEGFTPKDRPDFVKMVPLAEIVAEALGVSSTSKGVQTIYGRLIDALGNEIEILTTIPLDRLASVAPEKVADGVRKVRDGEIFISPGFDGQYGKVKIFEREETNYNGQQSLF